MFNPNVYLRKICDGKSAKLQVDVYKILRGKGFTLHPLHQFYINFTQTPLSGQLTKVETLH